MNVKVFTTLLIVMASLALCSYMVNPKNKSLKKDTISLGQLFFFDPRLSINKTKSCASCHDPKLAFTDGFANPLGATGQSIHRNSPSLINISKNTSFNLANPSITSILQQSNGPLFNNHPIEMGNDSNNLLSLRFIELDKKYKPLLQKNNIKNINWTIVKHFIAQYVATFNFSNSKYDKYLKKQVQLSKQELAGKNLFFGDSMQCSKCHSGNNFNVPENPNMFLFQNIGLYCVGKDSLYGNGDNGVFNESKDSLDIGMFKIPSLRNVAITAPYFHDGSVATLEQMIDIYARGGKLTTTGINKGDGKLHPNKHPFIVGFTTNTLQKKQLISFLKTLTDTSYLQNKMYQNPW
jgi:cytochrome c peroxidase